MQHEIRVENWSEISEFPLTLDAVRLLYDSPDYLVRAHRYDVFVKTRAVGLGHRLFVIEGRVRYTFDDGCSVTLSSGQVATMPSGGREFEVLSTVPLETIAVWSWSDMRAAKQAGASTPVDEGDG